MKLLFVSLGCDKNLVDSEYMLGMLAEAGYTFTNDELEADIIVINTCCFINDAKEESIQTILEMAEYKKSGQLKVLIVTGCLAERYQDEIKKEIPEVDSILGTNSFDLIIDAISQNLQGQSFADYKDFHKPIRLHTKRSLTTGGHYAHLKVAEGCNKHCTYCIIPQIRGNYRSVPMAELVAQAEELVQLGVKELILVAQETTLYGVDLYGKKSLHKLLDALNEIQGLSWIRIMYCYPEEIYEDLIQAIKRNKKVCHYLDMPIQHVNRTILKRMGRSTTKEELVSIIRHLREEIEDIVIRTTIICGFPGETSEMHEELMYFLNEMEFDRLGVFPFSAEEGTPAAEFSDQLPEERKVEWRDEVMELSEEIIFDINESLVGKNMRVMVEGKMEDADAYIGRTYRDAPDIDGYCFIHMEAADFPDRELMSGEFVNVMMNAAHGYDLIGKLTEVGNHEFTK